MADSHSKLDFFISRNRADAEWAVWIAWVLEEAGYTTILQDWDFRPGEHFVLKMDQAAQQSERTIAVLSNDYLKAEYSQMEWETAVRAKRLLPVRVHECNLQGLLGGIIYIDLLGLKEAAARKSLLEGVQSARVKPREQPNFPGDKAADESAGVYPRSVKLRPKFPREPRIPRWTLAAGTLLLALIIIIIFAWPFGALDCGDIERVTCLKLDLVDKPSETLCFKDGKGEITKKDISNLRRLTGQGMLPTPGQVNNCPCEWRGGTDKSAIESFQGSNCLFSLPLPDGVGLIFLNLNVRNQTKVFSIYVLDGRGG